MGATTQNAKLAACSADAPAPAAPKAAYAYGDTIVSAAPMSDGSVARGPFTVASGGASAECGDWAQVGFLMRVPRSLQVGMGSAARRAAHGDGLVRPASHKLA